jgi:adenosylcobinamide kinase / adenosylcobinamide-phosphate guanylyltransferase
VAARIALIGGGVRSGKSRFALRLGEALGPKRIFVATATASDDEMRARIERHRCDRGSAFATIEEPIDLPAALSAVTADVVVVDCVTHWLSNLLLRSEAVDAILARVDELAAVLVRRSFHAVLVTNEVGMSVHPPTPLGRTFVEVCGWTHQRLADVADDIYLAVLGTILHVRPALAPSLLSEQGAALAP